MQQEQISLGISENQAFSASDPVEPPPPYQPTPNNPPWNVPAALLALAFSMIVLIGFNTVPVLLYALNQQMGREQLELFLKSPAGILIQISGTIPAHILTLLFCWYVVTRKGEFSFTKTLGFKWGGFHLGYCLLSVILFYAVFGTLIYYFGAEDTDLTMILKSSRAVVYIVAFLAVVTAPLVEEVVHRGIVYSAIQKSTGAPSAILLTTVIFAAIHFPQYYKSWVALVMICFLSLGLTLIRWKSGNLLPCIVTHLIFNGLQAVGLLIEPYLPTETPEPVNAFIRLFY